MRHPKPFRRSIWRSPAGSLGTTGRSPVFRLSHLPARYLTLMVIHRTMPPKQCQVNLGLSVAPPVRSASPFQEDYIQPSLAYGLRIWWAYYWPTFLISALVIGVLSVLLRRAWEYLILRDQVVLWTNRILPYAVTFFVSMFGIHRILSKKFQSFCIALLPRNASFSAEALPRTSQRTLRVWWEFIWRSIVYSIIFRFAGSIALGLIAGMLASIGGVTGKVVPLIFQVLIDAAVGTLVIYSGLLDEEFGDFRVTLVPRIAFPSATPAVEPTAPNPVS